LEIIVAQILQPCTYICSTTYTEKGAAECATEHGGLCPTILFQMW
jgi:hypothetical protein